MSSSVLRKMNNTRDLVSFSVPAMALEGKVVVVSGDWEYVHRYFVDLAKSVKEFAEGWHLVLVFFGADENSLRKLLRRNEVQDLVTVIFAELLPHDVKIDNLVRSRNNRYLKMLGVYQYKNKFLFRQLVKFFISIGVSWRFVLNSELLIRKLPITLYACSRFVLPKAIFSRCSLVVIVDIDSIFTSEFSAWVNGQRKVGAVESSNSWSRFLAGIVVLPTAVEVQTFFSLTRKYFDDEIFYGRLAWGVDQLMLDWVLNEMRAVSLKNGMAFNSADHDGEAIISWKGNLKNERG